MYCERCKALFEGERCPACGSRHVRQPMPDDVCFLTAVDGLWSGMLTDVLRQHGIPALTQSNIGAALAMQAGTMFERVRFFVRWDQLPQAKEIVEELFRTPGETEEKS